MTHECCPSIASPSICGLCDRPIPVKPFVPPIKVRQQRAERRRENWRHQAAKKHAARLRRTPPWADLDAIRAIYAEAQRITQETGIPHHVDHVIPLQGATVSGLHVHTNMQILTGSENSRKHNRFEAVAELCPQGPKTEPEIRGSKRVAERVGFEPTSRETREPDFESGDRRTHDARAE